MLKTLYCILVLFVPALIFAQSSFLGNSDFYKIVKKDCDGKPFYKTEVLPSLKISKEAFGDSIKTYLKAKNISFGNTSALFRFFLTSHSRIINIKATIRKPSPDQRVVSDAILYYSDLWNPAVQNSYIVCAYVTLLLEFRDNKINITITQ